jgi:flagellar motor switch protein FliM
MQQHPVNLRPFVFFDEHRPTRAWMPTIAVINERFAQNLRGALLQHLQPEVEIVPDLAIEVVKHSDMIDRLALPTHMTVVNLLPLRGAMLVAAEAKLVS